MARFGDLSFRYGSVKMFDLSKCRLDDAEIVRIESSTNGLTIVYRDWQEQEHRLFFRSVVGFESFSAEGRALSHAAIDDHDPLLAKACALAEEDPTNGFHVYSFVSAWKDTKILRIVAKEVLQPT